MTNKYLQSQEYIVLTTIKNLVLFVLHLLININNRNIRGVHLYQDSLHLLQSKKKVLLNIFISCLNRTFLMHQQHPLQTWTQIRPQKMRGIEILEESSKADSSTEYLEISSCDLSNENKVINLLKQVGDKNSNETSTNMLFEIKKLRIRDPNKIISRYPNIHSLRNKFEQLKDTVMQYIDILV